jgi:hypothetical protein
MTKTAKRLPSLCKPPDSTCRKGNPLPGLHLFMGREHSGSAASLSTQRGWRATERDSSSGKFSDQREIVAMD